MKTKLKLDRSNRALITQPFQHLCNVVGRVQRAIEHYLPVGLFPKALQEPDLRAAIVAASEKGYGFIDTVPSLCS